MYFKEQRAGGGRIGFGSGPGGACRTPVDMRIVMDYRCHTPDRPHVAAELGTNFPAGFQSCMSRIAKSSLVEIMSSGFFTKAFISDM
eukprot:gene22694-29849_t